MATYAFLGLTGQGFQGFSGSGTTMVIRINVTAIGPAGQGWPAGTPGRYVGLGWVAPFDSIPANFDGSGCPAMNCIVNPVTWLTSLQVDLDLTPINTDVQGISGLAYGLNDGVSIDVYETNF